VLRTPNDSLILDEPQNMESEQSVRALSALDPLFALRYSATHRNPYNLVYRLTPFDAYRQGLVKRIEVASVVTEDSIGQPFIRLDAIKSVKKSLTAKLTVDKLMAKGAVKRGALTVKPGDSLELKTGRTEYAGYVVDEINLGEQLVRFANDIEINEGESKGADKEAIFAAQIQYTIEEHMRRQARLREHGIKVLSLFFIDKVDNYVAEDGVIRRIFDAAFNTTKKAHDAYASVEPERVREAYFAKRRRKGGETEEIDTNGKSKEDETAFDLIMRDKERLLSFEEPVSFIFSHSALREGWDNPNIFQICTLNQTVSEIKKRQEVGRGVRLAVNQDGDRVHDEQVNVLTVVANESYELYVDQLQREIEAEYGAEGLPPKPANARKRRTATLRKSYTLKPEFKELWERIKHKTRYAVKIDSEALLGDAMTEIDASQIKPPRVTITKALVHLDSADNFEPLRMSGAKTMIDLAGRFPLPNLVDLMANLMEHTTPPVRLTRKTLLEVYLRTTNKQAAIANPQEFASVAVRVLKAKLADHLVNGIEYTKIGAWYEMSELKDFDSWQDYLVPADRSLYDQVLCDSKVEREFVAGLEKDDRVKLYLKLPKWFSVTTPVGDYSPDWAIVMEDRDEHGKATDTLYLVRETKGANLEALRPDERRKIACGKRHFEGALGVSYRVVNAANDLP
jgi:type III restriction enzyme